MAFHNVPPNGFPDLPDVEELEAVIKDVTNLKTSVSGLSEDVSDLNGSKANQITIAPFFSEETAYEVGDLVYYNGLSYRCTNAHEGEWDADDFAATTIANELSSLMSGLTNATTVSSGTITAEEGVTITNYTLQKSLKTVYLYMLVKFTPTLGTGQLLCVLPSGYRAQSRLLFAGKNGTSGKFVTCETDGYGAVRIYPSSDDSSAVPTDYFLTITFFTS